MEIKNDEFQTLRLKVDQISSELEKQHAIRAVNTKWMVIVGSLILAALGFTSFVQVPREAANAAKEAIGPKIVEEAEATLKVLREDKNRAEDILSDMKYFDQLADKAGYAWVGSIKFVWGTRESTSDDDQEFSFKPNGKSDELNFKNECFTVITSLPGSIRADKTKFTFNRMNDYKGNHSFTFVAIGH